jgi:hypothetical protein
MNARRDSSDEPVRGPFGGGLLLTAAGVFALAATAVLILTDQQRFLRLGIVAALWAALVGAFIAARYRRQVADQEEALAERQERYELELEREIAARREYELEVAAEAKRQADEGSRGDIAALRQELAGLRQTLESLLGGEFLVERYALRAESTRMRSLPEDRGLKRLPPATFEEASIVEEAQTDLIERVREARQAPKRKVEPLPRRAERAAGRKEFPESAKPPVVETWQQVHPAELSDRWFVPDGLGTEAPANSQPYGARRYAQQTQFMAGPGAGTGGSDEKKRHGDNRHSAVASGYAEPVRRSQTNGHGSSGHLSTGDPAGRGAPSGYAPGGRAEPSGHASERAGASGYVQPVGRADSSGYGAPAGHAGSSGHAQASGYLPGQAEASGYGVPAGQAGSSGHAQASGYLPGQADSSGYGAPAGHAGSSGHAQASGYLPGQAEASGYGAHVRRAEASGYGSPVGRAGPSSRGAPANRAEASGYAAPTSQTQASGYAPPVRRAEASGYGPPASRAEASGYGPSVSRTAASGYGPPASRAEASGYGPPATPAGYPAHTPPASRANPNQTDTGGGRRRRAEGQPTWQESRQNNGQEAEPSGSHAAGRSVSELLASHGNAQPPTPRRRRRKE